MKITPKQRKELIALNDITDNEDDKLKAFIAILLNDSTTTDTKSIYCDLTHDDHLRIYYNGVMEHNDHRVLTLWSIGKIAIDAYNIATSQDGIELSIKEWPEGLFADIRINTFTNIRVTFKLECDIPTYIEGDILCEHRHEGDNYCVVITVDTMFNDNMPYRVMYIAGPSHYIGCTEWLPADGLKDFIKVNSDKLFAQGGENND